MTEETVQPETQPENPGVNISIEQILAAVINQIGSITIPIETLITNYGNKQIAVNQNEDKSVVFTLVDVPVAQEAEETTEETAE